MATNINPQTIPRDVQSAEQVAPVKLSEAAQDALSSFQHYAKERPDVVALWAFGIGFVLGWKLKPW